MGSVIHLCSGLSGGTGGGYHSFSIFCSLLVLLLTVLSCQYRIAVSVSLYFFGFLRL